jgi:hypothetical protein
VIALAFVTLGLLAWLPARRRGAWAVLWFSLAALTRESSLVAPAALVVVEVVSAWGELNGAWVRRIAPLLAPFGVYGARLLVLRERLGAWPFAGRSERMSAIPLGGLIDAASGFADPRRSWMWLLVGAVLLAAAIARRGPDPLRAVVVAFAIFGAFMGAAVWHRWQDFSRPILPLYAYGFLVVVTSAVASFGARDAGSTAERDTREVVHELG